MGKKKEENLSPRIVNRSARHDYEILETLTVGIALTGSEVKSIRHGQVSLAEGYAMVDPATMELSLLNVDIARYSHTPAAAEHEPRRPRKLLAKKREIRKLADETADRGITLVPLSMFFSKGMVKLDLGVGRGKKKFDKRESMKRKQTTDDIRRAMTRKRL